MKQSFQIKSEIQLCFKIVMLGSSSVGKTSIIKRFLKNEFAMKSMSTVGVACESKVVLLNNQQVKVQLWDTAGQERFRSLTKNYYRGCDAVVIVYDVSSMKSFDQVNGWIADFDEKCERQAIKMLMGNKIDLSTKDVSTELGTVFARRKKLMFQEVSAKDNINIENSFYKLIEMLIESRSIDQGEKILRRGSLAEGKSTAIDISQTVISKSHRPASHRPPEKENSSEETSKLKAIKSSEEISQEESPSISGPVLSPQTPPPLIIVTPPEELEPLKNFKKKHIPKSTLSIPLKLVHPRESEINKDEHFLRDSNQGCMCTC